VINLPHISNFTDFDPFENEPGVRLRYVECGGDLGRPDVIIVPGTKSTISDLGYLKKRAWRIRYESSLKLTLAYPCRFMRWLSDTWQEYI
jgi:cobyric acid synthase